MAELSVYTNTDLQAKIMDEVATSDPLLCRILTNNPQKFTSTAVDKVIRYRDNTAFGGYFSGTSELVRQTRTTKARLSVPQFYRYQPILVDQTEIDRNQDNPNAAASVEGTAVQEAVIDLSESMSSEVYGVGGVDSDGNQKLNGARYIIDNATDAATYYGLARSTYTVLNSACGLGLGALSSSTDDNIATYFSTATIGNSSPNEFYTTKAQWNLYEALITQTQYTNPTSSQSETRVGKGSMMAPLAANIGFGSLFFKGRPVYGSEKCPTGYWFGINWKHMNYFGLRITEEGAKQISVAGANADIQSEWDNVGDSKNVGMAIRGFQRSANQYGKTSDLVMAGQLVSFSPRHHMKLSFV